MTSKIEVLCRQAMKTFSRGSKRFSGGTFEENLKLLKNYANKITALDVCLEESLTSVRTSSKASVTYIRIYEDFDVSIGIFVLKPQASLPLHNHPNMHGILKVIKGRVEVQSYTPLELHHWDSYLMFAEKHEPLSVDVGSDVCTLEERRQNLHEIKHAEGSCAAFLDILAPPYTDFPDQDGDERDCFYYQTCEDQEQEGRVITRLVRIPAPKSYTCDSAQYLGPPVED
ncbi:2-aminoethanethiol dioxygenase [Neocloeon triangulifer]|uniref:2-aminoethanethiol dioxygenase n=1 Tax=Neocloeon triangulifer TaxID=2078957 RepID=UPI00286F5D84|nr:2-aminoethanethiol dioxygenase [Neocloeon triangulifer]